MVCKPYGLHIIQRFESKMLKSFKFSLLQLDSPSIIVSRALLCALLQVLLFKYYCEHILCTLLQVLLFKYYCELILCTLRAIISPCKAGSSSKFSPTLGKEHFFSAKLSLVNQPQSGKLRFY